MILPQLSSACRAPSDLRGTTDLALISMQVVRGMNMSNNSTPTFQTGNPEDTSIIDGESIAELVPIALLIIIANGLVLIIFSRRRQLRTPPNHVLFSLAICDFTTGIITIPLLIVVVFTPVIRSHGMLFYAYKLVNVLNNLTAISSCYHILVATTEKYLSILWPVTHRRIRKGTVVTVLTLVWLVSFTIAFSPFAWITSVDRTFDLAHVIFCLVAVFVLPYSFMIYAFVVIFQRISTTSSKRIESKTISEHYLRRQAALEKRCLNLFVCMAMVYLVCWLPWFILMLLYEVYDENDKLETPSHVFALVRYATSIINPVLYTFFRRDFRLALKSLFRRRRAHSSQTGRCSDSKRPAAIESDHTTDKLVRLVF